VRSYLDGDLAAIDAVPVEQRIGGDFVTQAWKVMRDIPAGAPVTYTQFAELAGRPAAVRGAASACARNPVALFVPCHRVLRTDGGLGGYRWGLPVKSWLLAHEKGRSIGA
jgi:methylated-DNA-[protein]-cysteine S-methyltransferase